MATKVERHLLTIHADRSISVETDIPIVAGSIGVDEVLISFEEPEDWADMSLTVTMVSSVVETPYTVLWDGESAFNVPWELTQEIGVIGFSVLGISSSTQSYQRGLTQSSVGLLTVVTPGINVGDPPVEPTPSAYERVLAMIQSLPEVESRAEAVINDLDNAFRGVAQYLPVGMGNVVTAELDGTDSELVKTSDAFKNGKLLGAKVYGKSEQFSTTGKNLIDQRLFLNCTGWTESNGVYEGILYQLLNTYGPSGRLGYMTDGYSFLENTVYTLSIFATISPNDASTSENKALYVTFEYTDNTTSRGGTDMSSSEVLCQVKSTAGKTVKNVFITYGGNHTVRFRNLQLEIGSTATDYEPYTGGIASPNPDYPQEIKSVVEGDLKLTGKCIWGGEQMADDIVAAVGNTNYAVKGEDENGKYIALTAGSPIVGVTFFKTPYNLNKCSFIVCARKNNNSVSTNLNFVFSDGTTRGLAFADGTTEIGKIYTMANVSDANKVVTAIQGSWKSSTVYIYYEKSGLFEGTITVDDFVPYSGDSLHFLQDDIEPLRSLPDGTRDVLTIDANGNGVIERNVIKIVPDFVSRSATVGSCQALIVNLSSFIRSTPSGSGNLYSDKFIGASSSSDIATGKAYILSGNLVLLFDANTFSSINEMTEWLLENVPEFLLLSRSSKTEIIPASRMPKVPSQYLHAWLEAKDQNGEEIVTDYSIYYEKSIGALLSQIEQALDAAGYPITNYEPEDAMSVAPVLSNDANPVTDAQMAAAVTYGFTLN